MIPRVLAAVLGAGLLLTPLAMADDHGKSRKEKPDDEMRRAIAFERYKDAAAARQARREAKHPSVDYSNADRSAERDDGKRVKDPGPGKH